MGSEPPLKVGYVHSSPSTAYSASGRQPPSEQALDPLCLETFASAPSSSQKAYS